MCAVPGCPSSPSPATSPGAALRPGAVMQAHPLSTHPDAWAGSSSDLPPCGLSPLTSAAVSGPLSLPSPGATGSTISGAALPQLPCHSGQCASMMEVNHLLCTAGFLRPPLATSSLKAGSRALHHLPPALVPAQCLPCPLTQRFWTTGSPVPGCRLPLT